MKNHNGLILGVSIFLGLLFIFNNKAFENIKVKTVAQDSETIVQSGQSATTIVTNKNLTKKTKMIHHREDLKPLKPLVTNLKRLHDCQTSEKCSYSKKSPRSYAAEVNSDIIKALGDTYELIHKKGLKDPRIANFAKKYLRQEHDLIKLGALKILSTQDMDDTLIPLIFSEVLSSPNPQSTAFSLKLLSQYKEPQQRQIINENLYKILTQGGVYPALEVTKNLDSILDDTNRNYFIDALQKIEKQKISQRLHTELKRQLDE